MQKSFTIRSKLFVQTTYLYVLCGGLGVTHKKYYLLFSFMVN